MAPEVPAHQRLYADVIRALPHPGDPMTVDAYAKVHRLLLDDSDERAPKDSESEPQDGDAEEKPDDEEGTGWHRGSHLADSSRVWTPTIREPDTIAFGFGRQW